MPWKVWYVAPHFRYERPQKGRYRQHWQVGAEVLGVDDPQLDVEVIALAHGFYRALGLREFTPEHQLDGRRRRSGRVRESCASTCSQHADALGDDVPRARRRQPAAGARLEGPDWQDVIEHAPQITENLGDEHAHALRGGAARLDRLGIRYEIDPRLVRGLDYYTSTTFEF